MSQGFRYTGRFRETWRGPTFSRPPAESFDPRPRSTTPCPYCGGDCNPPRRGCLDAVARWTPQDGGSR